MQPPAPPSTTSSGQGNVTLTNVQGDVMFGFSKNHEHFVFLTITDRDKFTAALPSLEIATSADVKAAREKIGKMKKESPGQLAYIPLLNIAFSQEGLRTLGISDDLGDPAFIKGQLEDARELGDDGEVDQTDGGKFRPYWNAGYFKRIDAVLLAAGESVETANKVVDDALEALNGSVDVAHRLNGKSRSGKNRGYEHFGWKDGISNPAIKGVVDALPGQGLVDPGVILTGHQGDEGWSTRPPWAFEGSFMVFRQLEQLVPEFHQFLKENAVKLITEGVPAELASEMLGSQMFGRWKNGVPMQRSPTWPNPQYADKYHNNDFDYLPQVPGDKGQEGCPYAAHLRKMRPRSDIPEHRKEATRINRQGIPYGEGASPTRRNPSPEEEEEHKTAEGQERGLAFVCYQSNIPDDGFRLLQKGWANAVDFPDNKDMEIGFDPLIGQANGASRETLRKQDGSSLTLPQDFIIARGGEYFFTPSIRALQTIFVGKPY
ncbi:hypothetical protein FRC10_000333 [Ceratobasidium sp. 414]|nr:hypothetical protein FRC10_000333 [Ceratobasidium sp. 414]